MGCEGLPPPSFCGSCFDVLSSTHQARYVSVAARGPSPSVPTRYPSDCVVIDIGDSPQKASMRKAIRLMGGHQSPVGTPDTVATPGTVATPETVAHAALQASTPESICDFVSIRIPVTPGQVFDSPQDTRLRSRRRRNSWNRQAPAFDATQGGIPCRADHHERRTRESCVAASRPEVPLDEATCRQRRPRDSPFDTLLIRAKRRQSTRRAAFGTSALRFGLGAIASAGVVTLGLASLSAAQPL